MNWSLAIFFTQKDFPGNLHPNYHLLNLHDSIQVISSSKNILSDSELPPLRPSTTQYIHIRISPPMLQFFI